ncbi:MAG: penicillin-binding protein 2 [Pseudomonadota bacterium]
MNWSALIENAEAFRSRLVGVSVGLVFAVLAGRAAVVSLQASDAPTGIAGVFEESVRRADIVDRHGELLATSVDVYSLFADPRAIWDAGDVAAALGDVFPDIDTDALTQRLSDRDRAFVWVRRGLTPRQRQAVFDLGLEGLGFREESRRAYPRGPLAGHVLGFAGYDGNGLAGVEFALDYRLAKGGEPVALTIDSGVQFVLESELAASAADHDVIGGAGVVLHAGTGEVIAMASWPPIDPNRAHTLSRDDPARKDRAAQAVYELGSVFKPLTIAAGVEAGAVGPSDLFDTHEIMEIGGFAIEDDHPIAGQATLADIIADSSNVGTVKVAMMLGERRQKDFFRRLGLFDRAPVELASSAAPLVPDDWSDLSLATISYGHGIAVSPVAFASAFSALANGGELVRPTLVLDPSRELKPRRVMSAPTAALVTAMMREAVTRGTGSRAAVAGYRVAGKTGTAEKPIEGGYDDSRNVTSFAALFPSDGPEYVVLITLDEPKAGETGGGDVGTAAAFNAAPTAGRVIERIAPLLGMAPDFNAPAALSSPVNSVAERRTSL